MGNCLASDGPRSPMAKVTPEGSSKAPKVASKGASPSVEGQIIEPNLKEFTYQELKIATKNFKIEIGRGGFGPVYKGFIDEVTLAPSNAGVGIPVAVKKCSPDSVQGVKEWNAEINFLGQVSHPNLVKLIGYCKEEKEKELLLVYEFMQKGSLETHLFQRRLPWDTRIKIAIDAARGLDFLHSTEKTVIYRDFKAANILLDTNLTAKLSDFGLARLGPPEDKSHVTTVAVGSYGYAAPEYVNTGHLYVTSDVYCFGVLLLELVTGMKAFDSRRPTNQVNLVEWGQPMLNDKSKLKKIIDGQMDDFPFEGVLKMAQLIMRCLQRDPKARPPMSEVLVVLDHISTIRMSPKQVSRASSSQSKPNGRRPMTPPSHHLSPIHYHQGTSQTSQPARSPTSQLARSPISQYARSPTSQPARTSYTR